MLLFHLNGLKRHKWSCKDSFSIAMRPYETVREPREKWASQQALINLSQDQRNKLCQWWLLLPMLTTIYKINQRMCVLESSSNEVGDYADGARHCAARSGGFRCG